MRITHVEAFEVVVPTKADAVNSPAWGPAVFDEAAKYIVLLHTDAGVMGNGESQRGATREEITRGARKLLGMEPTTLNLGAVRSLVDDFALPPNRAVNAFDTALYDLVGRIYGVPAHVLLGGACRTQVPVSYWTGRRSPQDIRRIAGRAREQGFTHFKFKLARAPGQDALQDPIVERMEAIVQVAPDMLVTVDPNEKLQTPRKALQVMEHLAPFAANLQVLESPIPQWNLDWYVFLRTRSPFAIGLHLNSHAQVINAVKREAADVMNLNGTLGEFVAMAATAAAAGIDVWHGSGVDLGLLDASYVHAAACAPTGTLGSDIVGHFIREHHLLQTPLHYADGHVHLPQEPGLGVELDMEAVRQYSRYHWTVEPDT